jgi:hypothetical protein
VVDRIRDQAHGRIEHRILKAVTVHRFGFPHAAQVLQVTRKTRHPHATRRRRTVTVYAITSLRFEQASPARLADLLRGHWAIEALHQLRDVTFAEDASQLRTGAGPSVMACLRNLVIGVLCRAGPVNVAAALRRHARDPRRPWPPSESDSGEPEWREPLEPRGSPRLGRGQAQPQRAHGQQEKRRRQGQGERVPVGAQVGEDGTNKEQDEATCGHNPQQGHAETHQQPKRTHRSERTSARWPGSRPPTTRPAAAACGWAAYCRPRGKNILVHG